MFGDYIKFFEDLSAYLFIGLFVWLFHPPKKIMFWALKQSDLNPTYSYYGETILKRIKSLHGKIILVYLILYGVFNLLW